jgi:H+/Cl- antiporter ClcA
MNTNDGLDKLRKINRIEAPPSLLARIQEKIRSVAEESVPVIWKWSFAAAAILIIGFNIMMMRTVSPAPANPGLQEVISALHLSTSNNLYNE